ncbi:Phenylalanine--tRNA ligase beta subunit [Neochlamydia sp. TUME1]|nr:Phenylalanine--tRNA ligase beta subunit [Neochlamydia sp. TUME1]
MLSYLLFSIQNSVFYFLFFLHLFIKNLDTMKISLNWLREYISIDLPPLEIAKALTSAGLEVEKIETLGEGFEGVVVAEVLTVEKHPEADRLCVAQVTDGQETYQVVCGASNCRPGIKTALARVGASLTDDSGKRFKIKKSKLRGIESSGMLCGADELGLGDQEHEGIIELEDHLPVGTDLAILMSDTLFEIGLTPNLGHCSSVIGVARELAAVLELPLVLPVISFSEDPSLHTAELIKVAVQDKEKCLRYACRVIRDVKVSPSPDWLKKRLKASGIRSINNIVDITNYVFLECGQPLHAFDYDKISEHTIVVRTAKEGEIFTTLDEKNRLLSAEDLLIADKEKGIALAGIMGGSNSEVTLSTQHILLEAAYFERKSIRKTSKRLGLQTDSSKRFEKGADPHAVLWALNRAAMLIQQLTLGKVAQGPLDIKEQVFAEKLVGCRLSKINGLLGTHLAVSEVETIFKRLSFIYTWDGQDNFCVTVPTYRVDVLSEVDLIEEVARIYGYDNISRSQPMYKNATIPHAPLFLFERAIKERLIGEGLQEFITCDLIGASILDTLNLQTNALETIKVLNPISVEQSTLRTSLLPGLLQLVKYNAAHQNHDIAGFEIGRIHYKEGEQYKDQSVIGIVLAGKASSQTWTTKEREFDFYDLKGMIENMLKELRVFNVSFKPNDLKTFHSGRQVAIFVDSLEIGSMGEIHPSICRRLDVQQRIYFAELNVYDLFSVRQENYVMKDIPIYPGSQRDWTVTVKEEISFQHILDLVPLSSKLLKSVKLLDIYRSEKLGTGLKNMTFRFLYRDDQKTLSQEEVDNEHACVLQETIIKL